MEVPVHDDWVGQPVGAIETSSGARVAYLMRFGLGMLPTPSTLLQDGDQVFMLVTDDMTAQVAKVTGASPEGGH
jgi:trk system potassium uptake protein TrkA